MYTIELENGRTLKVNIWDIVELETKNGRIYKVSIQSEHHLKRLKKIIHHNKTKKYEIFTNISIVESRVYSIGEFEESCKALQ